MAPFAHVAQSLLMIAAQVISLTLGSESSSWQQLQWQCLSESAAVFTASGIMSDMHCMYVASSHKGDLVAQWNKLTQVCSVYEFQQVCRIAVAAASSCAIYRKDAESLKLPLSVSDKLVAAWKFDDRQSSHSFLCRGSDPLTHKLQPDNINWSSEGAIFNGVDSSMSLNFTDTLSLSNGFTWLIRFKRQPRPQPLIQFVACSDQASLHHLWEWETATNIFFGNALSGLDPMAEVNSNGNILPNNATIWVNAAATWSVGDTGAKIFVEDAFLAESQLNRFSKIGSNTAAACVMLGRRGSDTSYVLNGIVRAVAFANVSMTEVEIRQFFEMAEI